LHSFCTAQMGRSTTFCCPREWIPLPQEPSSRARFEIPRWARVLRARQALALVALVLLLGNVLYHHTIDNQAPLEQLVVFPALVFLCTVMVSSAAAGSAWLSSRPLQFIAKISYGMYVWHVVVRRPFLTQVKVPETSSPNAWWVFYSALAFGTIRGTIVLALISWYVIEQPFLRLKRFVPSS